MLKSHRNKMSVIYMQSWKQCALPVIRMALWQLMHSGTWCTVYIYIYISVYSVYICLFIILWGWQLPLYFFPPLSCQAPFFEIFPTPLLKIPPPLRAKMFSQLPSPNHIFNGTFFFSLKLKLKKMSDFTYFETHLC